MTAMPWPVYSLSGWQRVDRAMSPQLCMASPGMGTEGWSQEASEGRCGLAFTHPSTRSFIPCLVYFLLPSLTHSLTRSLTHSLAHSVTPVSNDSLVPPLTSRPFSVSSERCMLPSRPSVCSPTGTSSLEGGILKPSTW